MKKRALHAFIAVFLGLMMASGYCGVLLSRALHLKSDEQDETAPILLSYSSTREMDPMSHLAVSHSAEYNIEWSFESSNEYIGIAVRGLTETEYNKLKNGESYSGYELSDGDKIKDGGNWGVPHEDLWYVVFLNIDEDEQATTLSYSLEWDNDLPPEEPPDGGASNETTGDDPEDLDLDTPSESFDEGESSSSTDDSTTTTDTTNDQDTTPSGSNSDSNLPQIVIDPFLIIMVLGGGVVLIFIYVADMSKKRKIASRPIGHDVSKKEPPTEPPKEQVITLKGFCAFCGAELVDSKGGFCSKCGAQIK